MNYNEYKKQEEKQQETEKPKIQFMGNLLKTDGASVIVRFPYAKSDDFNIVTAHEVKLPGSEYPQRVECTMDKDGNCPLCDAKEKKVTRFLVKALAYVINNNTNTVDVVPIVWDRPTKYADELADKMADYGDEEGLRNCLFKIRRNGLKTDTTYSTDIVTNKTIYRDDIYVKDFSSIESLDPSFLLIRRMSKYLDAVQSKEETKEELPLQDKVYVTTAASAGPIVASPVPLPVAEENTQPQPTVRMDPSERRPVKRFSNIK